MEQSQNRNEVGSEFFHDFRPVQCTVLLCHPLPPPPHLVWWIEILNQLPALSALRGLLKYPIVVALCCKTLFHPAHYQIFVNSFTIPQKLFINNVDYHPQICQCEFCLLQKYIVVWLGHKSWIRHSQKIKWSPLCMRCLFMLICILPVYQIFERENLNVQNRGLLLILHPSLDPPLVLNVRYYFWGSIPCAYI